MGMFPVFKQVFVDPKSGTIHFTQANITITEVKATCFETLWLGALAATSGLIKHQWTVFLAQLPD